eukprot:s6962_g3.t1
MLRLITGVAAHSLQDADVALLLSLPTAQEARTADIVRQLGWILGEKQPLLQEIWLGTAWGSEAVAMGEIATTSALNREFGRPCARSPRWRAIGPCVRQRGAIQPRRKDEFLAMQAARDLGTIFCHQHRQDAPSQELFQCTVCDQAFTSKAAQAAHMSKVHAPAAATRAARGTSCAVCMTEYWTAARLRNWLGIPQHEARGPRPLAAGQPIVLGAGL